MVNRKGFVQHVFLICFLPGLGMFTDLVAAPPQVPVTVKVQGNAIVTSEPAGINCPPACVASYEKSSTIVLRMTADVTSSFLGWEGACIGTEPRCEIKLSSPWFVLAVFEAALASPAYFPATEQGLRRVASRGDTPGK